MTNYLRFSEFINESKSLALRELTEDSISNLSSEDKQYIEDYCSGKINKDAFRGKDLVNLIKSGWLITFYPGTIAIRNPSTGESIKPKMTGDYSKSISNFINPNIKPTMYSEGLILIHWAILNGREEQVSYNEKNSLEKEIISLNDLKRKLSDLSNSGKKYQLLIDDGKYQIQFPFKSYPIASADGHKINGVPRADFIIRETDINDESNVLYISHKDVDFQQYSGMSRDKNIANHPEVLNFVDKIKDKVISMRNTDKGTYFGVEVSDELLSCLSLFGNDYGDDKFGINNCQVIFQGEILLEEIEGEFIKMKGSVNTILNPKFSKNPLNISESHRPMLVCAKSIKLNQFDVEGARFYIWPSESVISKKAKANYGKLISLDNDVKWNNSMKS